MAADQPDATPSAGTAESMPEPGQRVSIADHVDGEEAREILQELRAVGIAAEAARSASPEAGAEYQIVVAASDADAAYRQVFDVEAEHEPANWFDQQAIWLRALMLVGGVLISVVVIFFLMRLAI